MNLKNIEYIVKTITLVLIFTYLTDKVVFFSLNKISDKVFTGQSIGKLNHYIVLKDSLDFVVFGSSRANRNLNPEIISKNSFNMGADGRKLSFAATLIKILPRKKEQTVLLHIDPEKAYLKNYKGDDIQVLGTKYHRNPLIKNEIDKLEQADRFQKFYWSLGYNRTVLGIIKNYLHPNYNYKNYSGFDPIFVTENQKNIFKNILKNEASVKCENVFVINEIYKNYLSELKLFCDQNNKKLILFTSPKYNDQCKEDNLKFSQTMENMGLTYLDMTDYFKKNNLFEYWKDKIHLSNYGAEIFTEEFKQLLIEIK
ncbi:hypothetical protein [Algibacter pectinivorans]|uniref:Uncharacterized protein n=1 Tax=Algibacter pectinivorans TaxID=870482 RepID=A0A1I1PD06_9FLAO|nr:hypothetical protein [Algibacter pectinivorans]SFD07596.1 hypothetical protein SAMN04487987_103390 [Algibacter pectinivorans]